MVEISAVRRAYHHRPGQLDGVFRWIDEPEGHMGAGQYSIPQRIPAGVYDRLCRLALRPRILRDGCSKELGTA